MAGPNVTIVGSAVGADDDRLLERRQLLARPSEDFPRVAR
jgi:hypothetical protein